MHCDDCMFYNKECQWPEGRWKLSCLECLWDQKPCLLNREELVWHSLERSKGKESKKRQRVMESPPLGRVLVLDALVGLMDEVTQLWDAVQQHGELLVARLGDIPGRPEEERMYLKQDL